MMMNLFSMFDPASPNFLANNWFILVYVLFIASQSNKFHYTLYSTKVWPQKFHYPEMLFNFSNMLKIAPFAVIYSFNYFNLLMIMNWSSLIPYVFTATAQISITLALSLPIWFAANLYGWSFNTNNLLTHQIPQGTPLLLMPLMAMIEMVSNLIRPITLTVRLTANLLAGHILLAILMSASLAVPFFSIPLIMPAQYCLLFLEILVGYIQAHVFATLITLYSAEMAQ